MGMQILSSIISSPMMFPWQHRQPMEQGPEEWGISETLRDTLWSMERQRWASAKTFLSLESGEGGEGAESQRDTLFTRGSRTYHREKQLYWQGALMRRVTGVNQPPHGRFSGYSEGTCVLEGCYRPTKHKEPSSPWK